MKRMLANVCPELINEWSQRNLPLTPESVTHGSHKIVWWKGKCGHEYFNINTPKTKASNRKIPMIESVKEAFLMEKANQEKTGIKCSAVIDGYSDFIFVNRNGKTQHQGTLNKAIRRIIRDCNDEVLLNDENATVLLPHFSCHSLRHTFSTRMCEAGINVKVIQDTLGHQDISTTMNIYTDATKEMKKQEFESLDNYLKKTV